MSDIVIVADDVQEGVDSTDVGVIVGDDGRTMLVHTDIDGMVQLDIIERRTDTPIFSTTFAPGSTGPLYDTPQVDAYWADMDLIGFNFRRKVTVAELALQGAVERGGRTYDHVYRFNRVGGGVTRAIFRHHITAGAI